MTAPIVFLIGRLLVWYTGMYRFDLNRRYDRPHDRPPIQIKPVHSSLSYQLATDQKYDRRGHKSPSGYGP